MALNLKTYERTTTEVLDYKFDFAGSTNGSGATSDILVSGETISSYTITISDASLIKDSDSLADDSTSVIVWVSGGDITDAVYYVTCHIVTTDSREYDRTIRLIPVQYRS